MDEGKVKEEEGFSQGQMHWNCGFSNLIVARALPPNLLQDLFKVMMESGCEEVTLEAEVTNKGALALYGRLGFIRAKRLFRYYLNGVDAFRLKLLFPRLELSSGHLIIENEDILQESERCQ
ncbi:N-acetyltransferase domain-containing protein [Heracleum sosnowskyi]|uniref:N-acetyltransferase domain-containing protein n=1 Tax=Heracleum sosnowskyi TaxID=360622 RepID=A0AAD8HX84_9APIA|nr:N-acetyltransferase domain-containing protein [Heracleum sosnowskyi]